MTRNRPATPTERAAMGRRLVRVGDLTDRHHNRMVDVGGLQGELTAILTVGNRVQLALVVGGARAFTGWIDADDAVEVWRGDS